MPNRTIVKFYKGMTTYSDAEREMKLAHEAVKLGLPTTIPYGIVQDGNRIGLVFEYKEAETVANLIIHNPENFEHYMELYVNQLKNLQQIEINNNELPDIKEFMGECCDAAQNEKFTELIAKVPDVNRMIHCDYHVKNVIIQNDETTVIDMDTICKGHPIFDLANMYTSYVDFTEDNPENSITYFGFPRETALRILRRSFELYFETTGEDFIENIFDKCRVISYARMMRHKKIRGEDTGLYAQKLTDVLTRVDSLIW